MFKKKILENGGCIGECKKNKNSKYEYKGKCYFNFPLNINPSFYNEYECEDNCPNNQFRSIENNECIENCSFSNFFNQECIINPNLNIKNIISIISNIKNEIKNEIKNGLMNSLLNNINEKKMI
jgi:hypothetical protein